MTFLFIIQGEGRGHFTQAITLWKQLQQEGHALEKVLIGVSPFRQIPEYVKEAFPCEVTLFASPNFITSPTRTRLCASIVYNMAVCGRYFKSINFIARTLQQSSADKIVNFYEPLCGPAYCWHNISKPLICIAHQYMFLHPQYSFPARFALRKFMLKTLTRITCAHADTVIGLSLKPLPDIPEKHLCTAPPFLNITPPPPRQDNRAYLLCYLLNAGYLQELESQNCPVSLHVFSDTVTESKHPHIHTHPIDNSNFAAHMAHADGLMSTAGFETIAEAMYLHKPVWMVPANFEQQCNAHEAQQCGAGWHSRHFNITAFLEKKLSYSPPLHFKQWVDEYSRKIIHIITR
ncbi:MAG: hypothetical protein J5701_07360 [Bacteroidales bacterium]|nr:hypothetical protein [Bacteroidales bacterium]